MPEKSVDQYPYFLFTRTPLHVGAGQSVGYVDWPIQREGHTRIPIVPGSSLKGVLRDVLRESADDLFGRDIRPDQAGHAGSLLIGEARVLAFPVRAAKGCFAWVTCPLMLARYLRDTGATGLTTSFPAIRDGSEPQVLAGDEVTEGGKVVLEEYTFTASPQPDLLAWQEHLLERMPDEPVWQLLRGRLVIVPDGIFSFFVQSACEVAQHVAIDDESGTARDGALFNQENCPPETLFYGTIAAQKINEMEAEQALEHLSRLGGRAIQVGGGETTGLGLCTFVFAYNGGN